jgi:rhodanese-related sulfurtransferase
LGAGASLALTGGLAASTAAVTSAAGSLASSAAGGLVAAGTKAIDKVQNVVKSINSKDIAQVENNINSIAKNISKEKPVVVIGQTMNRVESAATKFKELGFKVKTYNPKNFQSTFGNLLRKDIENNRSWLRYWTQNKGATVVDIGLNPMKNMSSPFYDMEIRSLINWNYPNVIKYVP